jgi:ADP-heptose:LPS heptosyltransferase
MISALRQCFPEAYLAALVNSYNAPVLANNPELNTVFLYDKAKHLASGTSRLGNWIARWRLIRSMRRRHFDLVILATPAPTRHWFRAAQLLGARNVLSMKVPGRQMPRCVTVAVQPPADFGKLHAVEQNMVLLKAVGVDKPPGPQCVYPNAGLLAQARDRLAKLRETLGMPLVGLHISARKVSQRWPAERFIELVHRLHAERQCRFALFWSPGSGYHPRHPGDDEKAAAIVAATRNLPLVPMPTPTLPELIAGLALPDRIICSDGGAMHLAAALGKPIVCLFGDSDPVVWRPWGVPHCVIQPASRQVYEVTAEDILLALAAIENKV